MSAISRVNSGAQFALLQQVQGPRQSSQAAPTKKAGGDGDGDSDDGGSAPSVNESSESSSSGSLSSAANSLLKSITSGQIQQSQVSKLPTGSLLDVAA